MSIGMGSGLSDVLRKALAGPPFPCLARKPWALWWRNVDSQRRKKAIDERRVGARSVDSCYLPIRKFADPSSFGLCTKATVSLLMLSAKHVDLSLYLKASPYSNFTDTDSCDVPARLSTPQGDVHDAAGGDEDRNE